MKSFVTGLLIAPFIAAALFLLSLIPSGHRQAGVVESIHGIPFVTNTDNAIEITEKLAHMDIYLSEPVLAKNLVLELTYAPGNLTSLSVGVRENPFWLSYTKHIIYEASENTPNTSQETQNTSIIIPLTDKIQDTNRSIDVMFFAETVNSTEDVDENVSDSVRWQLHGITASVEPHSPNWPAAKDYIRSIVKRERPL